MFPGCPAGFQGGGGDKNKRSQKFSFGHIDKKTLTIVRLVGGAGLDSLHLLGLNGVVGQAEEEEERRHREGYGTAASPLERDHHGSVVNVHVCMFMQLHVAIAAQFVSWWRGR